MEERVSESESPEGPNRLRPAAPRPREGGQSVEEFLGEQLTQGETLRVPTPGVGEVWVLFVRKRISPVGD